ncbi:Toll-like receptor 7, partial [Ophiophagus hannah]
MYMQVDCSDRKLIEFPKDIPANVTNLTLAVNHISQISKSHFKNLKNLLEIDFKCNCVPIRLGPKDHVCTQGLKIQAHAFSKLFSLKSLYLDGNQLSAIPQHLPPNLRLLSLEANSIFSVKKENLSGLENLEVLQLGQNCYYRNPCNITFEINGTAFQPLTNLKVLSLKANNLSKVPQNLPSTLRELYLYNNAIRNIAEHDLSSLNNLEVLDLSGNCPRCHNARYHCTECPGSILINPKAFDSLKHLKVLRLHSTSLKQVDHHWFKNTKNLQQLSDLKCLNISNNAMSQAFKGTEFTHLSSLKCLDLSNNRIDLLHVKAFQQLKELEVLNLSDNSYYFKAEGVTHMLGFTKYLINLKILIMSGNEISVSTDKGMESDSIKILEFRRNRLDILWKDGTIEYLAFFKNLTTLESLDISENFLTSLPPDVFYNLPPKLKGYKRLFSSEVKYDAFVAYDNKDEAVTEWILKELIEKLEDQKEKKFNICLEERDWLPGHPLMENLNDSIHTSRKTIFVLTNSYIASGNFRIAFYMAHQRLLDEKVDTVLLCF